MQLCRRPFSPAVYAWSERRFLYGVPHPYLAPGHTAWSPRKRVFCPGRSYPAGAPNHSPHPSSRSRRECSVNSGVCRQRFCLKILAVSHGKKICASGKYFYFMLPTQYRKNIVDTLVGTPQCFKVFQGVLHDFNNAKCKQKSTDFKRINVKIGAFGGVREI